MLDDPRDGVLLKLDARITAGSIAWFGERHGTVESPRFVGDVVDQVARRWPVRLALELPRDLNIERREGAFWRWRDGRSSVAMVDLIDRVRARGIDIVAFDVASDEDVDANTREAAMADRIVAAHDPSGVLVVLSGNVHSRRVRGAPWDADLVPAAAHVAARGLPLATFDVAANGGTFWATMEHTGVHDNCVDDDGEPWTFGPPRDDTHDGVYRVGPTTASPPAIDVS